MIASRERVGAAGQRLLENPVGGVGADVEDRAHRLALHLRLVVVEQLGQVGQRFAAAELRASAESPSGARPGSASSSAVRSCGVRPTRTRAGSPSAARAGAARSSTDSASASGRTSTSPSDTHIAFTRSNCASSIVARCVVDVPHHRAGNQQVDGGDRVLAARRRHAAGGAGFARPAPPPAASAASKSPTSSRSSSSATTGFISVAPALLVLLDSQQVEDQRQVERAQRASSRSCRARRRCRSGGSSLTCSTSIACVRAPDSSRP